MEVYALEGNEYIYIIMNNLACEVIIFISARSLYKVYKALYFKLNIFFNQSKV